MVYRSGYTSSIRSRLYGPQVVFGGSAYCRKYRKHERKSRSPHISRAKICPAPPPGRSGGRPPVRTLVSGSSRRSRSKRPTGMRSGLSCSYAPARFVIRSHTDNQQVVSTVQTSGLRLRGGTMFREHDARRMVCQDGAHRRAGCSRLPFRDQLHRRTAQAYNS
eukprot:COSAG02_NODE_5409_length_4352_cov_3.033153_3_plen_163_part_00